MTVIYYNICEASKISGVEKYVLRFWESQFPMLSPRRQGNRRIYDNQDILLLRQIKILLYENNYTIKGAISVLRNSRVENNAINQSSITSKLIILRDKLARYAS